MLLDFERSGVDFSASARRLIADTVEYVKERPNSVNEHNSRVARSKLTDLYIEAEAARLTAYNVAWMQEQGMVPNKEASMSKVVGTETLQKVTSGCLEIMGLYGQLRPGNGRSEMMGRMTEHWMSSFSGTIAAGTSEIQLNIIATRGVGLPRG